jgi:ABC-2 type transport system ATP-binding protein
MARMSSIVVQAQDIEKHFVVVRSLYEHVLSPLATKKTICALKKVNFSISSGEILGVVGPNGAGKTTLLRILANLLEADGGWVKLSGRELNSDSNVRTNIGYVSSDERSFFWRLTGRQNLEFFARLYGVNRLLAGRRIEKLIKMFAVEEKADQLFRDYSTGTRKKFALARALIHQPKVLLLDEVTNSLDANSARNAKLLIREYVSAEYSRVGVWSTHRFEEIGEICDKVLVIDKGCVRFFGNAYDFRNIK